MTILGSLAVVGKYDGRTFDKGIDKSRRKTKQMQTGVMGLKTALAGVGFALVASRARAFAVGQLQMIDSLSKASRRLDLSTRTLGAYQYAAGLSGLETEQLNTALERMRDTIGAAALGEAGPARALTALGLDPEELARANDPLERIQKSLQGIGDQNTKLALVRDIFGRSGAQVLNLFEQNLSGVRKEYEKMGLAIDDADAQTIEKFNDQMSILNQQFAALGRQAVINAAPKLNAFVEQLNKGITIATEAGADAPGITKQLSRRLFDPLGIQTFVEGTRFLENTQTANTGPAYYLETIKSRPVVAQPSGLQ